MTPSTLAELRRDLYSALSMASQLEESLRWDKLCYNNPLHLDDDTVKKKFVLDRTEWHKEQIRDIYGKIAEIILRYTPVGVTDASH